MTKTIFPDAQKKPISTGLFSAAPAVSLLTLPHGGAPSLAAVYLSQISYAGIDLGTAGTVFYWLIVVGWVALISYFILFKSIPSIGRSFIKFCVRVAETLNSKPGAPAAHKAPREAPVALPVLTKAAPPAETPPLSGGYSPYHGFQSFAHDGALAIEDIVKGLSREHLSKPTVHPAAAPAPVAAKAKPIQAYAASAGASVGHVTAPVAVAPLNVQSLVTHLIEGDRVAVFAGLREFVRGGGKPENLVHSVICLLDETYRARIDGVPCEGAVARLTARLDPSTLENLISALTTAIDSSYSDSVTGAKLAFTRALAVLGA